MNRPLKILHIINELQMGGAPRLVTDIAKHIADKTPHSVGVLTIRDSLDSDLYKAIKAHPEISLYDLSGESTLSLSTLRKIRRIIRKYDVVHAHLFPSGYIAAIAKSGGVPVVYTEHSTHNRRRDRKYFRPVERWIYSRYDATASISDQTHAALDAWLHSRKVRKNMQTILNGTALDRFATKPEELYPFEVFGREGRPVIMISRFVASKDQATLIRSIPHFADTGLYVVFVGEGESLEECKALARNLGVESRCMFLGVRGDIPRLVGASFIGVQSSHWEGFGLTAIEMMAGGLPVVASDVPGLGDIVRGAGVLFPQGDAKALADAVNSLAANQQEYQAVTVRCLERAKAYDISVTVEKYVSLYHEVLDKKRNKKKHKNHKRCDILT